MISGNSVHGWLALLLLGVGQNINIMLKVYNQVELLPLMVAKKAPG